MSIFKNKSIQELGDKEERRIKMMEEIRDNIYTHHVRVSMEENMIGLFLTNFVFCLVVLILCTHSIEGEASVFISIEARIPGHVSTLPSFAMDKGKGYSCCLQTRCNQYLLALGYISKAGMNCTNQLMMTEIRYKM